MATEVIAGPRSVAEDRPDDRRRRRAWIAWLAVILAIFLCLFACGQASLIGGPPDTSGMSSVSAMGADYAAWQGSSFGPLMPGIVLDLVRDLGLDSGPPVATSPACLLGNSCLTATPPAGSATPTPHASATPGLTASPTATVLAPTATSVMPTNTPGPTATPTPLVYPVKLANPGSIPPGPATVDFTIWVINYGSPAPALLTRLTDTLPPEMSFHAGSCVPAGCAVAGQTVEWTGSWSIPQGSFIAFRFRADVAGTSGGEELVNWIEAIGSNFDLAVNNRRVIVQTPTPTATPTSIPVAGDDAYGGTEDTVLSVAAPGLLANDTDANGDLLEVQPAPLSPPAHGGVTLNPDGSFSYTPAADYFGVDSFVYRVCDSTMLCDTATVTITLVGMPDDPIALDDAYTTNEDATLVVAFPGVRLNDRDPDNLAAPLYAGLTAYLETGPANQDPSLPFALNGDGTFTYTPADNWNGSDGFTYYVCDAGANGIPEGPLSDDRCDGASVRLTVRSVNDAPVGEDHSVTTDEDVAYVFLTSDFPFTDPNDTPPNGLSAVVVSTLPASGTLRLSGVAVTAGQAISAANIAAGNFTYLSPLNANGAPYTSFTFRVRDNGGILFGGIDTDPSPNTQTINVTPVNDAPLPENDDWATDPRFITPQGVPLVVASRGPLTNDIDVDDGLPYPVSRLATQPLFGEVRDSTNAPGMDLDGGFTYVPPGAPAPPPDTHGPTSFTYEACDPGEDDVWGTIDDACTPATVTLLVDDAPVAQPDAFTLAEDTPLPPANVAADNGSGLDTDPNGDAMTFQLMVAPAHASVFTFNTATGDFTYTPALNYNGPDSFQYRAFDGWLYGNTVIVSIAVGPVNDPPVAFPDFARTAMDTLTAIDVLANDTDVEGQPIWLDALLTPPPNGTATRNTRGTPLDKSDDYYDYQPDAGFAGTDWLQYRSCDPGENLIPEDGDDLCDTAWVTIVVNGPPVALPDSYVLDEDTTLNQPAPGVLDNDSDPDNGDPLRAYLIAGPSQAQSFLLNVNGSFSYEPVPDYPGAAPQGPDAFTYVACDPGANGVPEGPASDDLCDAAIVDLTVNNVPDPPVANDDTATTDEDVPADIDVLDNDTDADGDPLEIVALDSPTLQGGTAVIDDNGTPGDPTDDFVHYTPASDFFGVDSFTYTIEDGNGGSDVGSVEVNVTSDNDPPRAGSDYYSTPIRTAPGDPALNVLSPDGVLENDWDPEGDPVAAYLTIPPASGVLLSTFACPAGLCLDGAFDYLANLGFHDIDTFGYAACDPGENGIPEGPTGDDLCTLATVFISVNAPPVAQDDPEPPAVWPVAEDGVLVIAAPDVLANDSDPDLDLLVVDSVGDPANGAAEFDDNGTPGNPADDFITYTPAADYYSPPGEPDSFTYRVCDPFGGCDQATIRITVLPVNDAPVAVDDPEPPAVYRANVGGTGPLVVNAAAGVLANDSDVDNPPSGLRAVLPTDPPHGSVFLSWDGSFTYTPDAGYRGADTFSYSVCDPGQDGFPSSPDDLCDVGEATIQVNGVPTAWDDAYDTDEDVDLVVAAPGVLGNDFEPDGESLTASLVSGPAGLTLNADGSFSYTPPLNFHSPPAVTFDYDACDVWGTCDPATATITVHPVNDPPTAVDDSAWTNQDQAVSIYVLGNDSDLDGEPVLFDSPLSAATAGGTAVWDVDHFLFTPNPGYYTAATPDEFSYTIRDAAGLTDTASVSVSVNGPPSAGPAESYSTNEDTPLIVTAPGLLANDSDPNSDPLEAHLVTGPAHAQSFSMTPDGGFSYTPAANYFGPDSFSYEVCDVPGGLCTAEITVGLTIVPVNDPPVAGADGPYTTDEDTPLSLPAGELLLNDSDPVEGSLVTAMPASGASAEGGSYAVAADGSFSYAPAADFFGADTFTYRAFDGTDPSAPATVTIEIAPVNDAPVAVDDSATTHQATPVVIDAVDNDYDIDSAIVAATATIVTGPSLGSVINNGDGTFTYTPASSQYRSDSFTYRVRDVEGAASNLATVEIRITEPQLILVKEADRSSAAPGEDIQFFITIVNNGPGTAFSASVTDDLGSCFRWRGSPSFGSLGNLDEGEAVLLSPRARVLASPPPGCDDTNWAEVTAVNADPSSDSVTVSVDLPLLGMSMMLLSAAEEPAQLTLTPTELTVTPEASSTVEATPAPGDGSPSTSEPTATAAAPDPTQSDEATPQPPSPAPAPSEAPPASEEPPAAEPPPAPGSEEPPPAEPPPAPGSEEPPGEPSADPMASVLTSVRWDRLSRRPQWGGTNGLYLASDGRWLLQYLFGLFSPPEALATPPTPMPRALGDG